MQWTPSFTSTGPICLRHIALRVPCGLGLRPRGWMRIAFPHQGVHPVLLYAYWQIPISLSSHHAQPKPWSDKSWRLGSGNQWVLPPPQKKSVFEPRGCKRSGLVGVAVVAADTKSPLLFRASHSHGRQRDPRVPLCSAEATAWGKMLCRRGRGWNFFGETRGENPQTHHTQTF